MNNPSEVARIKAQIADEYVSGKLALEGLAEGASQHQFITRRMEHMGVLTEQLEKVAGEEEVGRFLMGLQ